jgi:hypothetical protein
MRFIQKTFMKGFRDYYNIFDIVVIRSWIFDDGSADFALLRKYQINLIAKRVFNIK